MSRGLLRPLCALVLGLGLALALAEGALRLAPALAAPRLPLSYDPTLLDQLATGQTTLTFDADLGWTPTLSISRSWGGVRYRQNRDGLRAERAYEHTPAPGVRRVAAYGDSFTYCQEADLDDCWTRRLEALLPGTEVLNFGVPSYGPDQAWLRYQRDGVSWRPCTVLIGHMVENVNRVVNRFRPFYDPETGLPLAKPRFVLDGGRPTLLPSPARQIDDLRDPAWVEANLGPRDAWYVPGLFARQPLDVLELARLARTARFRTERQEALEWRPSWAERVYRPGEEAFEVLVAVLGGFAAQARADGATPVVLIFPTASEVDSQRAGEAKPHAALLSALQQRDVLAIDLTDALGEEARRSGTDSLVGKHYRPAGNAVVARTLGEQLPRLTAGTCGSR